MEVVTSPEPKFEWYTINTKGITQGDILLECPIVKMVSTDEEPYFDGGYEVFDRVIIMSQACDLVGPKVNSIYVCPIEPLQPLLVEITRTQHEKSLEQKLKQNPDLDLSKEPTFSFETVAKKHKKNIIDDLVKGNYLDYFVLNRFESEINRELNLDDFHVVYLRQMYSIPFDVINNIYQHRSKARLQLLPPYREQLGQMFARNFMRIGLPIDLRIDVNQY
jgi:hypothetical protein